ncbi:polysaccharide deacetylase family sporulation protein PdaB [Fontibacillus solani]|uniref:Polysaccharide deacetylase family sporulation protein PdaB n=1 Tax=Fontibacillus solani TaxID=1572857 RepID=A0A7W3XTD3_9BACL|nr:polysaccharide deacetylase family protein [Fontibacillus solani]MBA9087677.1 polysaccharide deacetylase family sporulation protein PdaB [Fontibacillus solani]
MLKTKIALALAFAFAVVWALFPVSTEAKPATHLKDRRYYEERGDIVWEVPTTDKFIAFTFDDGPSPRQTPEILKILEEYQAKATFFVIGDRVERNPEIVREELRLGHEVANHSLHHPSFQGLNQDSMSKEISRTQEIITQATGHTPTLFRPPGGFYNERLINISKQNHLQLILWSWHQDTNDWRAPGVQRIVNKVLNNARNGDIILMHDFVYKSSQTAEALKIILPELKKQGYSFVTVSELLSHKVAPRNHIKVNH